MKGPEVTTGGANVDSEAAANVFLQMLSNRNAQLAKFLKQESLIMFQVFYSVFPSSFCDAKLELRCFLECRESCWNIDIAVLD